MKLTRACMDDLGAILELGEECGRVYLRDFDAIKALSDLRREFRETHGLFVAEAQRNADKYARDWRRRS